MKCPKCVGQLEATAVLLDRSKHNTHAGHLHPSHTFVPASLKTYGHLGRPVMQCLRTLSCIASARSQAVTRGSFLASTHRDSSVALVQSQGSVYRCFVVLPAKASGRHVFPGADTPFLD
jgi:hypothetical protein